MRLIPVGLLAGVLSLGLMASTGPAAADARLAKGLTNLEGVQEAVDKVTYYGYGRGHGYRGHYGYRGGYGYRRHYGYRGHYGYRRHYGYRSHYRSYRRRHYGYRGYRRHYGYRGHRGYGGYRGHRY